ncbi:MAG TPA: serine hydrolase domain-containing protein [Bryobacteraceae bacterium]|nr:serine hydrolase domain-containing protein [Bryobacteraceae bacterium]
MRYIAFALIILLVSPRASQTETPLSQRIQRVETSLMPAEIAKGAPIPKWTIADRMTHYNVVGVSVAVIDNYAIHWAKGYGTLAKDNHRPVTTETLFQAGSISKPVAATAALHLVEAGKLSLDEDVNRKLKSWQVPENEFTRDQKVTLRRILSHSAGLTVHGFPGYAVDETPPSLVDILDGKKPANTAPIRVDLVPGSTERYSGGGYTIMQLLLTDVTGMPFPPLLKNTVLEKIGMQHSTYQQPLPPDWAKDAASGYRSNGDPVAGKWHVYPEMAAAGLWTTASDLAQFAIEIQKSREGRSNRVLSREMTNQMLTRQIDGAGLGLMLGGTDQAPRFSHGGADDGFQAFLIGTLDSGKGAIVMANSDNGISLAQEILLSIAAEYNWPDYKPKEH